MVRRKKKGTPQKYAHLTLYKHITRVSPTKTVQEVKAHVRNGIKKIKVHTSKVSMVKSKKAKKPARKACRVAKKTMVRDEGYEASLKLVHALHFQYIMECHDDGWLK